MKKSLIQRLSILLLTLSLLSAPVVVEAVPRGLLKTFLFGLLVAGVGSSKREEVFSTKVDEVGAVGDTIGLKVSDMGFPMVFYEDRDKQTYTKATCMDEKCTSIALEGIYPEEAIKHSGSSQISCKGYLARSYYDKKTQEVKVAVCDHEECTMPNRIAIEKIGEVGSHSAIEFYSQGDVWVAYYNADNHVKLAKVPLNASCAHPSLDKKKDSSSRKRHKTSRKKRYRNTFQSNAFWYPFPWPNDIRKSPPL